jgi:hypothetical protein
MSTAVRKLRGVSALGLTWALLWTALFAGLVGVTGLLRPQDIEPGERWFEIAPVGALVGLASGIGFGLLLALAENGNAIRHVPLVRAAMWGILASAAFPVLTGRVSMIVLLCPFGAAVAIASFAISRRAERNEVSRPRSSRDVVSACVLAPLRDAIAPQRS